jgi:hypothetical protein
MRRRCNSPFMPPGSRYTIHLPLSTIHYPLSTLFCLLLLSGCGGDKPALGVVCGTVTLDGRPLAGACVIFEPMTSSRASMGWTDAQGKYELVYIRDEKGAKVGANRVRITAAKSKANLPELLPPRYNAQTTLQEDVKAGKNEIDFPLTSK